LVVFGFGTLGCNAMVGNDGQYAPEKQGALPDARSHSTATLVSAGEVARSSHFKMVFSVGHTSMAQEKTKSSEHSMESGLVCTDGR